MNFFCFSIFLVSPSFIIPPASNQPSLLSRYIFSFRSDSLTLGVDILHTFILPCHLFHSLTPPGAPLGGFGGGGLEYVRYLNWEGEGFEDP